MKIVCHLSILHFRKDIRILIRECYSLVQAGYTVHFIVADGQGDETIEGVRIHDIGLPDRLPIRFFTTHRQLLRKALEIRANLYHFHDPELMLISLKLKVTSAKVITDVHEDLPQQFLESPNHNWFHRQLSSWLVDKMEQFYYPKLDAIITASPIVANRLKSYNMIVESIGCFPDLVTEFSFKTSPPSTPSHELVYVGSISAIRGIKETVELLEGTTWKYLLLGDFQTYGLENKIKNLPAWQEQVTYLGYTHERKKIINTIKSGRIGMATPLPNKNYATTYFLKIFEYMAAGIPVIGTNFPFWKTIIEDNECGITVDSTDQEAIKAAIQFLLDNPTIARKMGANGRRAIVDHYNWNQEKQKLLCIYEHLLQES